MLKKWIISHLTAPLPRQEGMRLAKKGSFPSVPNAGFCRFQIGHPFPPRLFAEME